MAGSGPSNGFERTWAQAGAGVADHPGMAWRRQTTFTANALTAVVVASIALNTLAGGASAGKTPARPETAAAVGPATAVASPYTNPSASYEVSPTGAVWPLGGARPYGQVAAAAHATIAAVTLTPDGGGYWLLTPRGGIAVFGDARWYGSPLHSGISIAAVGLVADPAGGGYWVYGRGGQVTAYGAAGFHGGRSWRTIVDMVATPDAGGYWLADADGVVSAFGDARSYGDAGGRHPPSPLVAMASTADGRGYWLVTSAGNVFNYGEAPFEGSLASHPVGQPIATVVPTADGLGYWLVTHDGDIHPFGDARTSQPPVTAFMHTVLTAGDRAVEWAMAQLGKPYAWGGTGPGAFDCSGLTMQAWKAADVVIPRIADDQFIYEPRVAIPDLVDGELVFWASSSRPTSIYHVAMYLGGGSIVDAPYTGEVVRTESMASPGLVAAGSAP